MKLNCPLPEAAAIVWTKDGTSLIPDNRTLIEHEQLHIRHAALTDSGLYSCQATGTKATDAVCFIVNVTGEMSQLKENSNRQCTIPIQKKWRDDFSRIQLVCFSFG